MTYLFRGSFCLLACVSKLLSLRVVMLGLVCARGLLDLEAIGFNGALQKKRTWTMVFIQAMLWENVR
ncbi:hypothetical protein DPMN_113395 [Dreissena polymorpha]|uniref:Uncharacterized protein n=1 Tax=Dreissena polymorpha TaxID=45954 RepID=A0A9D4QRU0_DREPO|nr:hypothetical protein DPMN_113395 [Dreissena polymorpha]